MRIFADCADHLKFLETCSVLEVHSNLLTISRTLHRKFSGTISTPTAKTS